MVRRETDDYPDSASWTAYKNTARRLLPELAGLGLDQCFRLGMSMSHIVFSTLDHRRIGGEPHVTLIIEPRTDVIRVMYSYHSVHFDLPLYERICASDEAAPIVVDYLKRLWLETKPGKALPTGLYAPSVNGSSNGSVHQSQAPT